MTTVRRRGLQIDDPLAPTQPAARDKPPVESAEHPPPEAIHDGRLETSTSDTPREQPGKAKGTLHGGPIGNRIIGRRPSWLEWQVIQNANAYEVGFTALWDGIRAVWLDRTPETEAPLSSFL